MRRSGLVLLAFLLPVSTAVGSTPESPDDESRAAGQPLEPRLWIEAGQRPTRIGEPMAPYGFELPPLDVALLGIGFGRLPFDGDHPGLDTRPQDSPESWRAPNRFWTALEISATIAGGGANYWYQRGGHPWWGLSNWPNRLSTDIYILDTNDFRTNFSYHTIAGAAWHLAPRSNDLSLLESLAWGVGASLAWEYVIEFRDKVDVNDLIFTTPAGVAVGEFAHHFGRLLHQGREGRGWDLARWTLGFPQTFNDRVRGEKGPRGPRVEHDLYVAAGAGYARGREERLGDRASDRGVISSLRAGGHLSALDGAYAAGTGWRGFREANFSSLELAISGGSGGRRSIQVVSDAVLAGWRYRDVAADLGRGSAVNVGTSTGLRYHQERYGPWRDRLGMAHLPGLAIDAEHWSRRVRARGLARLHVDYGGVHALGYPDWQSAHPDAVGLSAIEKEGYYHAWGGSLRLGAELEVARLRAGGSLFLGTYRPHRSLDEFREGREHHDPDFADRPAVTDAQRIASRFSDYELWLGSELRGRGFIQARTVWRSRRERFEEFDTRAGAFEAGIEYGRSF